MKLTLKKESGKKGFIGGKPKYTLVARVEMTTKEKEVYDKFHLDGTLLYKAEANSESFRQYGSNGGMKVDLFARLLLKKKIPEIKAHELLAGLTFEDEHVLSIIETEQRVMEAANTLDAAVKAASVFIGESSLDLPVV
jgi:hypothetical protein